MKKLRGYIFSRPFMGERVPQNIQNLVIRNFCENYKYMYLLSAAEYSMENSDAVLKSIINNSKGISGIVAYSLYQLPKNMEIRTMFLKKIIRKKMFFVSAIEQTFVKNNNDINDINRLWQIKEILKYCPKEL
jgi:sporadic carbohydrate cluster protein (TIGR04323 family)